MMVCMNECKSASVQLHGQLHRFGQFIVTAYGHSWRDVVSPCGVSCEIVEWRLEIEGLLTFSFALLLPLVLMLPLYTNSACHCKYITTIVITLAWLFS